MLVLCVKHMLRDLIGKLTHGLRFYQVSMIYWMRMLLGHLNHCSGPKLDQSLFHWNFNLHRVICLLIESVLRLSSTMLGILTFFHLELKLQQMFLLEV